MTSAVTIAAEWQLLYDKYYRCRKIYDLHWDITVLDKNRIAAAPFGGPVAAIRDDSKIVQLGSEPALRKLRVFNSAGVPISETVWRNPGGRLVGMSWSDDQVLVCVTQDGSVYRYDVHAELVGGVGSMGKDCFEHSIVECVFWGNGVVCVNEVFDVFCCSDLRNLSPVKMGGGELFLEEFPLCMAVVEPQYNMSGSVMVVLGVGDGLVVVEEDGVQRISVEFGPVQKMAVSWNGKLMAVFTHDRRLLVFPTADLFDLTEESIKVDYTCEESALPPNQLAWCGMDSVLLSWNYMLLMVGPDGEPVSYPYDEKRFIIIPECDGARILSGSTMEFLQRVPDSTESIFRIGSAEPAALLYDAWDYFVQRSAKADENLREIRKRKSLPEAVEACVDAAGHEFDVSLQNTLIRAASYGQSFCRKFRRDSIQETCKTLRVLNAVRSQEIGIPLSIQQYKLLTPSVLIGRLINSHHHFLALKISEYLGINQEMVIMHWACSKITTSTAIADDSLLENLIDKLKLSKGVSYAAVAAHADKAGRRKLAAKLVEHEPHPSKQVPLLLSIEEEDTALLKATESGDTDLVYLVLFHILQKKPAPEFFGMMQARLLARDLFITYARCYRHEFLKDFFLSTGQLNDVAFLLWNESWELAKNPPANKGYPLHVARIKLIEKAQNLFMQSKENSFESKAAEEHAKLLRIQHELEVSTKQAIFVDSSISDTIRTCIVLGNHRAAIKVKTEFKVSEKRWYWLKVFALATIRDWDALEKFSKEKKPPTGFKPFVEACIDAGEKAEALKYIPKLTEPRDKAEYYARIGMAKEAADAASQTRDGELLGRLKLTFSQNSAASSIFDTLRDRLSFQGVS